LSTKDYFLPQSLDQALALLEEHGISLLVMAGGTLAMPLINEGLSLPEKVMGLRHAGLNTVERSNGAIDIGATTTLSQVEKLEAIPMMRDAAHSIGGWQIRNMGTVGGNLFAPPPAGDLAAALLALDAQVKLVSMKGKRMLPLTEFYTGFLSTALASNEILAGIHVPVPQGRTNFKKLARKKANTPAIVSVAIHITLDQGQVRDARIGLNAAGPFPFRATRAEAALIGSRLDGDAISAAAEAAVEESNPFTDAIATDWYRRKMVGVLVGRALSEIGI
jgi:xanthine dehydrogenase small subunit